MRPFHRPGPGTARALVCLLALCAASGCGSGGGSEGGSEGGKGEMDKSEPDRVDAGPTPPAVLPLPDAPVRATLTLERRGDKLVADSWIEAVTVGAPPDAATPLWADGGESCTLQRTADGAATPLGAQSFDGGERMTVSGRAGEPLVLERQRVGTRVAYATDARWRVEPLPDDAVLTLPEELVRRGLASASLRPQAPLDWKTPSNGHLREPRTTMRWSGSADADDRMVLQLSSWRPGDDRDAVRVRCEVFDDGEFSVPEPVDAILSTEEGGALVSAMRLRMTSVAAASGDRLEIVQSAQP